VKLSLSTAWQVWSVSHPSAHGIGGWVDFRAGRNILREGLKMSCDHRDFNHALSLVQFVG